MPSVPGYVHTPGNHCGSTALRNLLAFHGVEISEEMAFGLGAGAGLYYLALDDTSPSRWFNGRTARLAGPALGRAARRRLRWPRITHWRRPPSVGSRPWRTGSHNAA